MPQLNISNTATAASVVNVIAGWQYEYLPWPARIKLLIRATIVGVTLVVFSGSETIMEESPIQAGGTAGRGATKSTTPPTTFYAPSREVPSLDACFPCAARGVGEVYVVAPLHVTAT